MKGTKLWVVTLLVIMATLCLGGPAMAEKVLSIGIKSADMGIVDPHLSATTANLPIMDSIFNGLVRFRPGSVVLEKIEPDLAESWTSSPT